MKTYRARIEQDETGTWCGVVDLGANSKAISDGPTLERARENLRESVALALDCDESDVQIQLEALAAGSP